MVWVGLVVQVVWVGLVVLVVWAGLVVLVAWAILADLVPKSSCLSANKSKGERRRHAHRLVNDSRDTDGEARCERVTRPQNVRS